MTIWRLAVPLGLLAAPRAIFHDLDLVREGTLVNAALVFVPLLIWIVVAARRAARPFLTLLAAGGVYGACLALVHNVFWSRAFEGDPPALGGNLAGRLSPGAEDLLFRGAMSVTSLFTGLAVGAVCGAVAWGVTRLLRR
ncbi:hypothetical protein AB0F81_13870 [Actinoplanes sp. NPDC024001]|uniref:hypothetical protein n=1 Tax=Actinoplanes sp. NPDC024001 TaxID=3154598 RepID=UPI00340DDEBA